ncbi:MAG TPA: (Fe-S)-binding protein [Thermodesulfobacteriota bacterium]|nr:(Fe-S)-binding protein [Thermodesulfobacteriota bacterium]
MEAMELKNEVYEEVSKCNKCGFCLPSCPVFLATGIETYAPRGRNAITRSIVEGKLKVSPQVEKSIYQCIGCKACVEACFPAVRTNDVVVTFRKRLASMGSMPEIHKVLLDNIRRFGNPLGEAKEKRTEIYPKSYEDKQGEALLFLGCVPSYQDLHIVPSTMEILKQASVSFSAQGTEELCCGYLAYLVGSEYFEEIVRQNIEKIEKQKPKFMITPCAGCTKAFRELYPTVSSFDIPIYHTTEYLQKLIEEGRLRFKKPIGKRVAYHDPCDLGRHLKVYEPPRAILKALPGVEFLEFPTNRNLAKCCGGGGGVKAFDINLSGEVAKERILEASRVGAEIVVSGCPSCKSNLQVAAAKLRKEGKAKIKVMDITELVVQSLEEG